MMLKQVNLYTFNMQYSLIYFAFAVRLWGNSNMIIAMFLIHVLQHLSVFAVIPHFLSV